MAHLWCRVKAEWFSHGLGAVEGFLGLVAPPFVRSGGAFE